MKYLKYLSIAALLAVTACSATTGSTTTDTATAAKSVYTLKASYGILLSGAVTYNSLTPCATPPVQPCRDPAVVAQLRLARDAASPAINSAENAVRTLGTNPTVVQASIAAATAAVDAFKSVSQAYGVAK